MNNKAKKLKKSSGSNLTNTLNNPNVISIQNDQKPDPNPTINRISVNANQFPFPNDHKSDHNPTINRISVNANQSPFPNDHPQATDYLPPTKFHPKIYRKTYPGVIGYPGYDMGAHHIYCGHHPYHQGLVNNSWSREGAAFQVGSEWIRADEVALVIIVLMLWFGAITMFINRWGKLRMLEPYQPAYSAPVSAAVRPANLAGPNGALGPQVAATGPTIQIQNPPELTFCRAKRIESLNSFRDNFREGYKDAYRYWGTPSKSFTSGLGISGMAGVWGAGSSTLGIGIGNIGGSFQEYRRASSGSTLGLAPSGSGIVENGLRSTEMSSCHAIGRSHSISGSAHRIHQCHVSSQNVCGERHGSNRDLFSGDRSGNNRDPCSSDRDGSTHNLLCGDHKSYHRPPPIINIADTSITITNTDDDSTSNSNSRNNSVSDLRNVACCVDCGDECCHHHHHHHRGGEFRPLSSQIKVRSAVDLVTLVMQEKRNCH
ncbi:uncharacterized protein LOC125177585 [Hyalella azteca]|uniref:Uncharacterized protein LOC125177585 n=1 Tax=Hyalella azteca TaxID=294128 RepID=A0A979FFL1_HYAAZ|nr:uncharacterized protein LOC125177585 [Hyalella azteca]